MKRLTVVITIAVIIFVLTTLFVFMCLPFGLETVPAVNGILDLHGKASENSVYQLNGEWEFIGGRLLTPQEFPPDGAETIMLPPSFGSGGNLLNGCGTYRLLINTDGMNAPMLYIPEIYSAYVLYVNGGRTRAVGVVSESADGEMPLIENALVPVSTENNVVELVIQVSNHSYFESSMSMPLLFGECNDILAYFYRTRALYCASLGGILMAVFHYLVLYIFRRREKIYLIFSLLCLLCCVRFLLETNGINQFFGWFPMDSFGIRLYAVLYFFHCLLIVYFTIYVFRRDFLIKHKHSVAICMVFGFLFFLLIPLNQNYTIYAVILAVFPFIAFATAIAARSPVIREIKWSRLYFTALLLYATIGFTGKVFFENKMFMVTLLTNTFMVMAQSLVLSKEHARAFELVEEQNDNLERIVCERTEDLRNANSAMKELIVNISHDLKTPVTVMSVNLEELSGSLLAPNNPEYRRRITLAYRKSLDLQRLLQNLLEVSRIETGQSLYASEPVQLSALLVSVQEKYGDFLDSKGLFLDIDYNEDALIIADTQRIWSVFDNLIYNSARHTDNGGITIAAEVREAGVTVSVSDTGCGIASVHLPHIFKRFYKVSAERGAKEGQSGLGLYIVKSVMEGIGGGVTAQSELGKGTSVTLTFRHEKICHDDKP